MDANLLKRFMGPTVKRFLIVLTLPACLLAGPLGAGTLDVDSYLSQVRQGNAALRGGQAEDAALGLAAKQPLTAYSTQLTGFVQEQNNEEVPQGASILSPADTESLTWDSNLSKFFSTGTQVGLDYAGDRTRLLYGALPAALAGEESSFAPLLPPQGFVLGQELTLSVSQSLWRNFMASQVEAGVAKAAADSDAARASNRYQAQALLYQARQAYVSLVTVRQVTAILNESLKRNQKILDWTKQKYDDNLADKVDVLEGEASLRQVALNLAQNREDEAKAVIAFNTLRGALPTAHVDALEPLSAPESLPTPKDARQDLAAAEAALRSSDAQVAGVTQSFTPDLSVFASVGGGERPIYSLPADMQGSQPDTMVGLKFSANLDFSLYRQVLAGARQAEGYGQDAVDSKKLQIAQDWAQLKRGFSGVKERLALARQLETLQREKADREKTRYEDGRTTNFQVLRFQDDYNLSRVQVLQLTAQANELEAQARYYNGDDQPW